jgi:biopolymer transport protein ExbD
MNFRRRSRDEPEINLIPFIDVLLVVLIFLMLSTSYSKYTEMQLQLPVANGQAPQSNPKEILVAISNEGRYMVNQTALTGQGADVVAAGLLSAGQVQPDSRIIISADARAPHQSVMTVMEAARRVGLAQITFAAQSGAQGSSAP